MGVVLRPLSHNKMFVFLLICNIFLVTVKSEGVDEVKKELNILKNEMAKIITMQQEMIDKLEEKMDAKTNLLEKELEAKTRMIEELETQMQVIRVPPVAYSCGWKGQLDHVTSTTVKYDKITYERTNDFTTEGGHDVKSGLYTVPYPGTYTVTYSLRTRDNDGDVVLWLRKNSHNIAESHHISYNGGSSVHNYDQGGRTLVTHLGRGDNISLFCEDCDSGHYGIYEVLFCVELSQFDVEG